MTSTKQPPPNGASDPAASPAAERQGARLRVIVTGGNGFVGRGVVRLLYREHDVLVIDNLRSGPLRFRDDERDLFQLSQTDIRDADAVAAAVTAFAPDVIVHLAAIHYIPECEQQPELAVSTNIDGTVNLLTAAPAGCRFVFASSGAVYEPDDDPHRETGALRPSDIYGFSKLHGEHYLTYLAAQRGLAGAVVRLFNVVGPGETNPHLVPEIVAQLKSGRKELRLGNMQAKRDYIHVRDAALGFVSVALGGELEPGRTVTVNLGTSRTYSVAEIVQKFKEIAPVEFSLQQDKARLRKIDRPHLAANINEIERQFGWRPCATIDDALADIWRDPDLAPGLFEKYQS